MNQSESYFTLFIFMLETNLPTTIMNWISTFYKKSSKRLIKTSPILSPVVSNEQDKSLTMEEFIKNLEKDYWRYSDVWIPNSVQWVIDKDQINSVYRDGYILNLFGYEKTLNKEEYKEKYAIKGKFDQYFYICHH